MLCPYQLIGYWLTKVFGQPLFTNFCTHPDEASTPVFPIVLHTIFVIAVVSWLIPKTRSDLAKFDVLADIGNGDFRDLSAENQKLLVKLVKRHGDSIADLANSGNINLFEKGENSKFMKLPKKVWKRGLWYEKEDLMKV